MPPRGLPRYAMRYVIAAIGLELFRNRREITRTTPRAASCSARITS
jgi:hypothetical protein